MAIAASELEDGQNIRSSRFGIVTFSIVLPRLCIVRRIGWICTGRGEERARRVEREGCLQMRWGQVRRKIRCSFPVLIATILTWNERYRRGGPTRPSACVYWVVLWPTGPAASNPRLDTTADACATLLRWHFRHTERTTSALLCRIFRSKTVRCPSSLTTQRNRHYRGLGRLQLPWNHV